MDRLWPLGWVGAIGLVAVGDGHLILPIFLPVVLFAALLATLDQRS